MTDFLVLCSGRFMVWMQVSFSQCGNGCSEMILICQFNVSYYYSVILSILLHAVLLIYHTEIMSNRKWMCRIFKKCVAFQSQYLSHTGTWCNSGVHSSFCACVCVFPSHWSSQSKDLYKKIAMFYKATFQIYILFTFLSVTSNVYCDLFSRFWLPVLMGDNLALTSVKFSSSI